PLHNLATNTKYREEVLVTPLRPRLRHVGWFVFVIAFVTAAPSRGQRPTVDVPSSVLDLQMAHDRALIRDLTAYIAAKPGAPDVDQAYLAIFDKAIEHDWFGEHEETARRYLATFPDGPVRALAQIVATMARAH